MTNDLKNKVLRRLYQGNKFNDDLDLDTYHHAEAIEKIFESLKGRETSYDKRERFTGVKGNDWLG